MWGIDIIILLFVQDKNIGYNKRVKTNISLNEELIQITKQVYLMVTRLLKCG